MKRFIIMLGFVLMFAFIRVEGNLNMYINTKYSYLSVMTISILSLLCVVEFIRVFREERAEERRKAEKAAEEKNSQALKMLHSSDHSASCPAECDHDHRLAEEDAHGHRHGHGHDHDGHSHGNTTKLQRAVTYLILCFPIYTGIFLPIQTLDSSFVKAKGFSFPSIDVSADNPGNHQFLRPDTSIFYGKDGYEKLKKKELAEFSGKNEIHLSESDYLKGMEVLYNYPGEFMGKTVSFDGFVYKGEQVEGNHYFVFRFGFIHCAADSGVFGMLVDFPKGTVLKDDDWVHVAGKLSSELYQPFKQTIPVLEVDSWERLKAPKNPYVYRNF